MKKPELYHKTVDILVQAYFNDTLERMNCMACAVGNIVAANMGYTYSKYGCAWKEPVNFAWFDVVTGGLYKGLAKEQIDSTGYSPKQIIAIEAAFEYVSRVGGTRDEKMFNGLMAVIEVLDQIHKNTDTEITKVTKQKFVRA